MIGEGSEPEARYPTGKARSVLEELYEREKALAFVSSGNHTSNQPST